MRLMSFAFALLFLAPAVARANDTAIVGKEAPAFELTDTDGKRVSLASFKGKVVVLEWFNADCPFVKYAHGDGPLKAMAAKWQKKGVVWLAINSNAPGKQGAGKDRNAKARTDWNLAHPILLDEPGTVGKLYGAKTTPHMYVIDAKGVLVYAGGLDNAPLGKTEVELVPYVDQALEAVLAGKAPPTAETKPYGCSVKYAQ
jgi:peroxiredoxin